MIDVLIDGAARNQGGVGKRRAAWAVVIFKNGTEIFHVAGGLGDRTNNEAEYQALISALLVCSMMNMPTPTIYSDSQVVVNHTTGKWACGSQVLLPYYLTVRSIASELSFRIQHVSRSRVSLADQLCNQFLDEQEKEEENLILTPRV